MKFNKQMAPFFVTAGALALLASTLGVVKAQQPPTAPQGQAPAGGAGAAGGRGAGRGGGGVAPALFTMADANKDGAVTRAELMTVLEKVYSDADAGKAGSITPDQLLAALNTAFPA